MGSRGLVMGRCTWLSTLLPCVLLLIILPSMVKANGCSIQGVLGLDLVEPCLNHQLQGKSSMESCCQALNQMVKAGYHCLCLLLSSSTSPLLSTPLSLPFADCYISVPPLMQCPGNTNVPGPPVLPPIIDGQEPVKPPSSIGTIFTPPSPLPPIIDGQEPVKPPSSIAAIFTPPSPPSPQPPIGMQTSMNFTQGSNFTTVEREETHSNRNGALNSTMPDNTRWNVMPFAYSGECRKQAKIWTCLRVVCIVATLLRTGFP